MGFGRALTLTVVFLVGLPLVVVGLAALGPVGWVVAAVVLPLATLAVILWFGWIKRQPDDGPDTMGL